jgi:acyl-CoA thioester hydrolase
VGDSISVHRLPVRVTYHETDGQRRVHHSNYLNYFERGRVEMLRSLGVRYRDLENSGLFLVVTEMNVQYHAAAEFDDLLDLETSLVEVRKVRLRHSYRITRGQELIVQANSVIACIGEDGSPKRLPQDIFSVVQAVRQ